MSAITPLIGVEAASGAVDNCNQVNVASAKCMPYVMDKAGSVTSDCCAAVKGLASSVKTSNDKQEVCKCMKAIAAKMPGIDYARVGEIPRLCKATSLPVCT
ncbi:hypothetical protein Dimus_006725 [Dionaea muscipula]